METAQAIVMLRLQIAILERLMFTPQSFTRADERDHQFLIHDAKLLVARLTSVPADSPMSAAASDTAQPTASG